MSTEILMDDVTVSPVRLSDGSIAHNVYMSSESGEIIEFACEDESHAESLAERLRKCAWFATRAV